MDMFKYLTSTLEEIYFDFIIGVFGRVKTTDVVFKLTEINEIREKIDQGHYIKSIRFQIKKDSTEYEQIIFNCKINRHGRCEFIGGDFKSFYGLLLLQFMALGHEKLNFYDCRGCRAFWQILVLFASHTHTIMEYISL